MDAKRKRNENWGEKTNPVCPSNRRCHTGECLKSSNKCFACGEAGDIKKNCPKLTETKKNASVPAMLNIANARDAARNNLAQVMITISSISTFLLF